MFTFANPLFLWGLLGLAAPVLIHLINRDLFRPLRFPSVRFILRGKLPVERKRRLRDLLLLALRMLLFTAIIGALARPQWQPAAAAADVTEADGELVILIDASASMSGWNAWENAVARAEDLLASHNRSPAGLVISAAGPLTVEPLTTDHASLRARLNQSAPQNVAGDHRESFRQALRLFQSPGPRTLAILSDFQQSDWSPASFPEAAAGIEIDWIPIGPENRPNAAILHARALPLADGRRQIVAEIKNFGSSEIERTLHLRAGEASQSRDLRLAPNETRSLSLIVEEISSSRAELFLDPDAFPDDDRYFLWLGRPPALQVLAVAPTDDEPEKAEELFFVSRALSTSTESQWLQFAVNALPPGQLSEAALQNAQAVLLLGAVPYLNASDWTLLHNYLNQGGRLFITPGKAPARQTTLLASQGLIDLDYDGLAGLARTQARPHGIDWVLPDSALDLLFRDQAARSLSNVSIYQYVRFRPQSEDIAILLRTENQDPLLVQREVGPGLILASAFPFQVGWTDLPVSTAFLPMIRELVAGNLPPDYGILNLDTGATAAAIAGPLNLAADDPVLANLDPLAPGIHVFGNSPVVLNLPRSESIPDVTNPVDLQTAVAPRNPAPVAAAASASTNDRIQLWPWLALAALFLFILEMPLAAWLRRTRRTESAVRPAVTAETTAARPS